MLSSRWSDDEYRDDEDESSVPPGGCTRSKQFTCRTFSSGSGSGRSCGRKYLLEEGNRDVTRKKSSMHRENEEDGGSCTRRLKRRRGSYTVRFSENCVQEYSLQETHFGGKDYMSSPCLVAHRTSSDCSTGSTGFEPDDIEDDDGEVWTSDHSKIGFEEQVENPALQEDRTQEIQTEQPERPEVVAVQTQTQIALPSMKVLRSKTKAYFKAPLPAITKSSPRLAAKSNSSRHNVVNVLNNNNRKDRNNNKISERSIRRSATFSRSPPVRFSQAKFHSPKSKDSRKSSNVLAPLVQKAPVVKRMQEVTVYQMENGDSDEDGEEDSKEEEEESEGGGDEEGDKSVSVSHKQRSSEGALSQKKTASMKSWQMSHSGGSSIKDSFFEREMKNEEASQKRASNAETQPIANPEPCFLPLAPPPPCIPQPNEANSMFKSIPPPPPGFCQEIRVNVNQNPPQVSTQVVPCPGSLPPQPPQRCFPPPPSPPKEECSPPPPYQCQNPDPCVPVQITCAPTLMYSQQSQQSSQCCCQSRSGMFCRLSKDQRIRCQRCRVMQYCRSILGGGCGRSLHAGCNAGSRRDFNNNGGLGSSVYVMPPYQVALDNSDGGKWKSEYSLEFKDWSKQRPARGSFYAEDEGGKGKNDTAVSAQGSSLGDDDAQRKDNNSNIYPSADIDKSTRDRACSPGPPGGDPVRNGERNGPSVNNWQRNGYRRYGSQSSGGGWNAWNQNAYQNSGIGNNPMRYPATGPPAGQLGYPNFAANVGSYPYGQTNNNSFPQPGRYYPFQNAGMHAGGGYNGQIGYPGNGGINGGSKPPNEYVFLIGPGGTLISGSPLNTAGIGTSAYPPPNGTPPAGPYGNIDGSGYPPDLLNRAPLPYPGDGYGNNSNAKNNNGAPNNAHSSTPTFDDKYAGPAEYDEGLDWDDDPYPFFTKAPTRIVYSNVGKNEDKKVNENWSSGQKYKPNAVRESNLPKKPSNLGYHHPHESHVHYTMQNQRQISGDPGGNASHGTFPSGNERTGYEGTPQNFGPLPGTWRTQNPAYRVGMYGSPVVVEAGNYQVPRLSYGGERGYADPRLRFGGYPGTGNNQRSNPYQQPGMVAGYPYANVSSPYGPYAYEGPGSGAAGGWNPGRPEYKPQDNQYLQQGPGVNERGPYRWPDQRSQPGPDLQQSRARITNVEEADKSTGPGPWGPWGKEWVKRNGPFQKHGSNDKPSSIPENGSDTSWEDISDGESPPASDKDTKGSTNDSSKSHTATNKSRKSTVNTAIGPDHNSSGDESSGRQPPKTPPKKPNAKPKSAKVKDAAVGSPPPSSGKVTSGPSKEKGPKAAALLKQSKKQLPKETASMPALPVQPTASKPKLKPNGESPANANEPNSKTKIPPGASSKRVILPKKAPGKNNAKKPAPKTDGGESSNGSSSSEMILVKTTKIIRRKSTIFEDEENEEETNANQAPPSPENTPTTVAGKPGTATKAPPTPKGSKRPATKQDSESPAAGTTEKSEAPQETPSAVKTNVVKKPQKPQLPNSANKAGKNDSVTPPATSQPVKGKAPPTPATKAKDQVGQEKEPGTADDSNNGGDVLVKKTTTRKKISPKKEPKEANANTKITSPKAKSPAKEGNQVSKDEIKPDTATTPGKNKISGGQKDNAPANKKATPIKQNQAGNKAATPPNNSKDTTNEGKKHSVDSKSMSEGTSTSGGWSGTTESSGSSMIMVKKTTTVKRTKKTSGEQDGGTSTDFSEPPTPPSTAPKVSPGKTAGKK